MKTLNYLLKSSVFAAVCILVTPVFAQQTAFTYQGQLQNNGTLANGTFNLKFTLFTNNAGGTAIAGSITNNSVAISNGLFTVMIDFGPGPWNGESNWLEIAVETNGAGNFTVLAPRQPLTPAPYAIFAESANAAALTGFITDTELSTNVALIDGNQLFTGENAFANPVGIGTASPGALLQLNSDSQLSERLRLSGREFYTGAFDDDTNGISLLLGVNRPGNRQLWIGDSAALAPSSTNAVLRLAASDGGGKVDALGTDGITEMNLTLGADVTIQSNGFVGIGTTSPSAALQVNTTVQNIAMFQSSFNEATVSVNNTSSGGNDWQIVSVSGGNGFQPGGLLFATGVNAPALILAPNGYVGIDGTAQPAFPLAVGSAYCDGNTWHNASDRALKENFSAINPLDVLDKVVAMPIREWNYKKEKNANHLGPVAQDFHAAFQLDGSDDKSISTVDEGGVALAAIQGLNQKVESRNQKAESQIEELKAENGELKRELEEIKATLRRLDAKDVSRP